MQKTGRNGSALQHPDDQEQLEGGPSMASMDGGAQTGGSIMNSWKTASPSADATKPESMPQTKSTALPGETVHRTAV